MKKRAVITFEVRDDALGVEIEAYITNALMSFAYEVPAYQKFASIKNVHVFCPRHGFFY